MPHHLKQRCFGSIADGADDESANVEFVPDGRRASTAGKAPAGIYYLAHMLLPFLAVSSHRELHGEATILLAGCIRRIGRPLAADPRPIAAPGVSQQFAEDPSALGRASQTRPLERAESGGLEALSRSDFRCCRTYMPVARMVSFAPSQVTLPIKPVDFPAAVAFWA